MTLYKGDNLQAFDGKPIEVSLNLDEGEEMPIISKAIFVINNGIIAKTFDNPTFPLEVELDETDTAKLSSRNQANLIIYDSQNRKLTCDGTLTFIAESEIYHAS
jgi:hypothetical protein